jgi:hypothetical protein
MPRKKLIMIAFEALSECEDFLKAEDFEVLILIFLIYLKVFSEEVLVQDDQAGEKKTNQERILK